MPTVTLEQTTRIMAEYQEELINGSITERLDSLFREFSSIGEGEGGYVLTDRVSDRNFSKLDGIRNFVEHIGPLIPKETLHTLVDRMINHLTTTEDAGQSFMRNASLAKVMLAYELSQYPDNGARHLTDNTRIKEAFAEGVTQANFETTLLAPDIRHFRLATAAPSGSLPSSGATTVAPAAATNPSSLGELSRYYKYVTRPGQRSTRQHFFELKDEVSQLKGDALKTKILSEFKELLEACRNKEHLNRMVTTLVGDPRYQTLATGQGIMTRLFGLKTSSVKAFEQMVKELSDKLPLAESSGQRKPT